MLTAAEFVEHLRSRGARVACGLVQCPAHNDEHPSLSVRLGLLQPVMFHCFAGCSQDDVLAAAGLSWANVLHRTGTDSFVVRGLVPCDHDHSADGFEGMSFEPFWLGTTRGMTSYAPKDGGAVGVDLDGELPQVEREYAEQNTEPCVGMFTVSTPKGARHMTSAVLTDFVNLVNERRRRAEVRAVPYGSRWAAERLGLEDPQGDGGRRVRAVVSRLVDDGVLIQQGKLGRTPLYALGVHVRCPEGAREVEAAALVGLDDQAPAATSDSQAAA